MSEKVNIPDIDQLGRDSILSDLDKNLFVIAGAGSGKTSMLVARMVAMIKSGIDISKICAITFTKKAAAEFLSRFQKELKEQSNNPKVSEVERNRCKVALEKIDLCFTGTIDSFCNLVLSEYPNNADIPSSSAVVEDEEFIALCKKEYEKIANDVNSPIRKEFETFNKLVDNGADTFSRSINDVINVSHLHINYPVPTKSLEEDVKELASKYESKIQNDVRAILKLKVDLVLDDNGEVNKDADKLFKLLENNEHLLLSPWTVNNFIDIKNKIKSIFKSDLRFNNQPTTQFIDFAFMPKNHCYKCVGKRSGKDKPYTNIDLYLNDVHKIVYSHAMHFLVSAANAIKAQLKSLGKLSFNEYLMIFRNMIIEDMNNGMKLIKHIRNKHSYFLIDESQDTSPAQTELFLYLTSEVEAHSLKDCEPQPGHIFIVGDPKQSIYGFRGADVNAYLGTKELFESVYDSRYNKVVYLTRNYRSTYELKEYFNDKFNGMDNYKPIPLDTNNVPKEIKDDVLSGVFTSLDFLLAIKALVGKHYIFDSRLYKENPSTYGKRLIEYKDIMLLTWSTTNHDRVMNCLKENDIPFYCEGKFNIYKTEIVETLYALYSYVADVSGQLQNLLASPLFNIQPNELLGIYTPNDIPDEDIKNYILSLERYRDITNPVTLLSELINGLGIFKDINYTNMEYALFVLEKMKEEYASLKISDIKSGAKFLKDFLSTKLERCMNMEFIPNAVNLANVHKVKGLEKPVVILVACISPKKAIKNDSDYLKGEAYVFRTGEYYVGDASLYDIECGDLYDEQEKQGQNKKQQEKERLCYVAATRARNILVLPPYDKKDNNPWTYILVENAPSLPYSDLPDVLVKQVGELTFTEPGPFDATQTYIEKSPSAEAHIFSKYNDEVVEPLVEEQVEEDVDSRTKGTIVHKLMQKIVNSKGKLPKEALIKSIIDEYSLDDGSPYKAILENVYDTMFTGGYPQSNGVSQDLLNVLFKSTCLCEVPFSYREGHKIWQGEIDLVYVYEGQYYIVDYKTNSNDEGLDEKYKKQLEAYKKVLKLSLGVEAITYIYHIDV